MKQEKSCGAVIFHEQGPERFYLILHSTQGHWTLCKGHVEGNETERETAVREIKEETGLPVSFVEGFRRVITYAPCPDRLKDVVFFLARANRWVVVCQPEEIAEAVFLPLHGALERLTHASDRDTLLAADAFLREQGT